MKISIFTVFFIMKGEIFVKNTKTKKMVLVAILMALGMILNLIEIPYPFAPWLSLDLSEIVVLVAIELLGIIPTLFVCIGKCIVSLLFKGPVGPFGIGQITAMIASMSIALTYHFLNQKVHFSSKTKTYIFNMFITMLVFALIMYIINYLFVTPTYLMNKPTWYTNLPFSVDIQAFNGQYGSNLSVPSILNFMSPYAQAIFIIYFPFNFIKGILCALVYRFVQPIVLKTKETL